MGANWKTVERMNEVEIINNVTCDECGVKMSNIHGNETTAQPEHGMNLVFSGGYGQFIDGVAKVVLCKNCMNYLMYNFPNLANIIRSVDAMGQVDTSNPMDTFYQGE